MRTLPPVLQRHDAQSDRLVLEVEVPSSLPHFEGHFPGYPILPGIAQLDWAIAFARQHFAMPEKFAAVEKLKFNAPVLPDCHLTLTLDYAASEGQGILHFSYRKDEQAVSSGRVVFVAAENMS